MLLQAPLHLEEAARGVVVAVGLAVVPENRVARQMINGLPDLVAGMAF